MFTIEGTTVVTPRPHGAIPLDFVTSNLSVEADIPRYNLLCNALKTDDVFDASLHVWGSNCPFADEADRLTDKIAAKIDQNPFMPRVLGGFSGGADVLFDVMERLKQKGELYYRAISGLILVEPSPYRGKTLEILKAHQHLWHTDYENRLTPEARASLENRQIPRLSTPITIFLGEKSMALLHMQAGAICATMPETTQVHIVPEARHVEIVSNPGLHESVAKHARNILTMGLGGVAILDYENNTNNTSTTSWQSVGQGKTQIRWEGGYIHIRNNEWPDNYIRLNPGQWACIVNSLRTQDL